MPFQDASEQPPQACAATPASTLPILHAASDHQPKQWFLSMNQVLTSKGGHQVWGYSIAVRPVASDGGQEVAARDDNVAHVHRLQQVVHLRLILNRSS